MLYKAFVNKTLKMPSKLFGSLIIVWLTHNMKKKLFSMDTTYCMVIPITQSDGACYYSTQANVLML